MAVGSVLWRFDGALYCTAIVKATLTLPEGGRMQRINPTPICRADDYLHGLPSLAAGSEIAPRLTWADVTVVGRAHATKPDTCKRAVRLMMVRGDQVLIDKTLYVYGDRDDIGQPKPFESMRIGYERALGGLDHEENPVGIGLDQGSLRQPNVVDPERPYQRVAGFGPVPSSFPQRRRRRGSMSVELMAKGIADYPVDFDWEYFQAAPPDQRLPKLHGDEWVMLEGMHPGVSRIRARLPRLHAQCRVYAHQPVGAPELVELKADQLHVEPEHDRCSMVWRGRFAVASELAADQLVLAGAIQEGDHAVAWPANLEELEGTASPAPASSEFAGRLEDDLQMTAPRPVAHRSAPPEVRPPEVPASLIPPPPSIAGPAPWAAPSDPGTWLDDQTAFMSSPSDVPEAGEDWSSTDEMADPEQAAAEDAGLMSRNGEDVLELDDDDLELVNTQS